MNDQERIANHERFVDRLMARRPQDRKHYEKRLARGPVPVSAGPRRQPGARGLEAVPGRGAAGVRRARAVALETIVLDERPVLFVKNGTFDTNEVTTLGPEATELVEKMKYAGETLLPLLPLIGRIDVVNSIYPYVGSGWFVAEDIVVTNRHVARLIAQWDGAKFVFQQGIGKNLIESSFNNAHEFDEVPASVDRIFKVKEVLYIERDDGPNDIAFLRVAGKRRGNVPRFIPIASSDPGANVPVCVIGYPARAPHSVIPNQDLMKRLYRDRFDVKRAAPGMTMEMEDGLGRHDCTTLGGNSGSVVLDLNNGHAVGLHFSGLYREANYAVRASTLTEYVKGQRWNFPPVIETPRRPAEADTAPPAGVASGAPPLPMTAGSQVTTLTYPLTVTVITQLGPPGVGSVVAGGGASGMRPTVSLSAERVEQAVKEFWARRPKGVLAARVGYLNDGENIGDQPCIAASVAPDRWAAVQAENPREFEGVPVRYFPAEVGEQIEALPIMESVTSVSYDDDARAGKKFSFDSVNEVMNVTLHVGPEYSWEVLSNFLAGANGSIVSAMYEFHAVHIKDALESRLSNGSSLRLVLDNSTFPSKVQMNEPPEAGEFDRLKVFEKWAKKFTFDRIVAPEGVSGLISDSYHIKVTVRDDHTFWLSSGNWKGGSSQPVISKAERDQAARGESDLRGNREWHVVIQNETLANRFRSHIEQDFKRSADLGSGPVPKKLLEEEPFVDVPLEETPVLERRPPSGILEPLHLKRKIKVRPLLTPDRGGAVFSNAVLDLIRSAKKSLLFQIPYIGMPPFPDADRGFIDKLITALTEKLINLDDARVILRSGGSAFSSPTHAAWFFKSKGVKIEDRLRVIENHHTKGMIVDGKRVLLGSHNWSAPGVTLNRDASLIFNDEEVAQYYRKAFEIDWARSNKIKPKRFEHPEAPVLEAVGAVSPVGYVRRPLSELLKDD